MLSDSRDVGIKGSHGRTPFRGRTELRLWSDGVKGSRQPFLLVVGGSRAAPFHGYAAGFARLKIKKRHKHLCLFLFYALATATASATVAPTIGLFPIPINPIMSTCAGTEEEPANCASLCILPIVSVMP